VRPSSPKAFLARTVRIRADLSRSGRSGVRIDGIVRCCICGGRRAAMTTSNLRNRRCHGTILEAMARKSAGPSKTIDNVKQPGVYDGQRQPSMERKKTPIEDNPYTMGQHHCQEMAGKRCRVPAYAQKRNPGIYNVRPEPGLLSGEPGMPNCGDGEAVWQRIFALSGHLRSPLCSRHCARLSGDRSRKAGAVRRDLQYHRWVMTLGVALLSKESAHAGTGQRAQFRCPYR